MTLADPATWPAPQVTASTLTSRYGMAVASAWDRGHPRLTHRAGWLDHDGPLPVIEGTLIRLQVDHLPGDRDPKPVWPWFSGTGVAPGEVGQLWQSFLRRFDLEHTFSPVKQVLGWTAPKIRDPAAADRWTWLIIACHAQLRWPGRWPATCAAPGRNQPRRAGSPRPGSAADSGTSARRPPSPPVRRNPASPASAVRQAPRTAARTPPRHRQIHQEGNHPQGTAKTSRLRAG
jgi:hypothetical protein